MRKQFQEEKRQLKDTITVLQEENKETKNNIATLKDEIVTLVNENQDIRKFQKSVPLNMIYIQYPHEVEPASLWNCSTNGHWVDISNTYADLFFRVNGNMSTFGALQEENIPRFDKAKSSHCQRGAGCAWHEGEITIPIGDWSHILNMAADSASSIYRPISFHTSGGEVRPRNMAIKIWKCVV